MADEVNVWALRKVIIQLKRSHILQQSFMNKLILVLLKRTKLQTVIEWRMLTNVWTIPARWIRMVLIVWNTSTICSVLKRSRVAAKAQNVPVRPIPSLNSNIKNYHLEYVSNTLTYLQWAVIGPFPVLRWTRSMPSNRSITEAGLLGQEFTGHCWKWNWVMVRVSVGCTWPQETFQNTALCMDNDINYYCMAWKFYLKFNFTVLQSVAEL